METHRLKIIHRKVHPTNPVNQESAEAVYRAEQERIAARSRRLAEAEERVVASIYGADAHAQERRRELERTQIEHAAAREAARRREAEVEAAFAASGRPRPTTADAAARPWTASALDFSSERAQHAARKLHAEEVAETNRALMTARAQARRDAAQRDREADRRTVTDERSYWNLGASSSRYVAPDQRWLAAQESQRRSLAGRPSSGGSGGAEAAAAAAPASPRSLHARGRAGAHGALLVQPPWALDPSTPLSAKVSAAQLSPRPVTPPPVSDAPEPRRGQASLSLTKSRVFGIDA